MGAAKHHVNVGAITIRQRKLDVDNIHLENTLKFELSNVLDNDRQVADDETKVTTDADQMTPVKDINTLSHQNFVNMFTNQDLLKNQLEDDDLLSLDVKEKKPTDEETVIFKHSLKG
ncbi:Uncharacterised protein r2_g2772 [Pycnogonum litorale]